MHILQICWRIKKQDGWESELLYICTWSIKFNIENKLMHWNNLRSPYSGEYHRSSYSGEYLRSPYSGEYHRSPFSENKVFLVEF